MQLKKLFVGNLPWSASEDALRTMFSQDGMVVESVQIITDRETGRSKGFGFVEMATVEDAEKACNMFNNYEMDGRKMVVNEARPREERPRMGGGRDRY
jgi:RNA recognition motif-containing protein